MISVSVAQQTLSQGAQRFVCSTARLGVGERDGSGCTPRGPHVIAAKIGHGLPMSTVFQGRQPVDRTWYPGAPGDWIMSRILWLRGTQAGLNSGEGCDSYQRFIYIHATPPDQPMGVPLSHGCIRLSQADMLRLFEQVSVGESVLIKEI